MLEVFFWQHARVQNTDDIHPVFCDLAVEDHVAPLGQLPIARNYLNTTFAQTRILSQEPETLVELQNIVISLGSSPAALRVPGNGFEICLGFS